MYNKQTWYSHYSPWCLWWPWLFSLKTITVEQTRWVPWIIKDWKAKRSEAKTLEVSWSTKPHNVHTRHAGQQSLKCVTWSPLTHWLPELFAKRRFLDILVVFGLDLGQIIFNLVKNALASRQLKVSATLQDLPHEDRCSAFIFLINPNKPHIFRKLNSTRWWLILLKISKS